MLSAVFRKARFPQIGAIQSNQMYRNAIFGASIVLTSFLIAAPTRAQNSTGDSAQIPVPDALGDEVTTTPKTAKPPEPWPEVRAKRIGVPTKGAGNLINVQIRPGPKTIKVPPAATPAAPAAPADLLNWYWDAFDHHLQTAGPERFTQALAALDRAEAKQLSRPSFQAVTDIARQHGKDILISSIGTDVSPALALAVIAVESAGRSDAESAAGAQGLMQLIPETAARFGVTDAMDPAQNIKGGVTYLDWLIDEFAGDVTLALAGYNAGENAVKKHNGPPPYPETRAYVPKVLAAWQVARRLCVTPPDLYADGCVFATDALKAAK